MLPIHTILHPTDFSPRSTYAFHLAFALARDYGAKLIVTYVHIPPPIIAGDVGVPPPDPAGTDEELTVQLNRIQAPDPQVTVERMLLRGAPAEEIVRLAAEPQCDLIVMGTHGRTGLGRLLMGSVAELVLRR